MYARGLSVVVLVNHLPIAIHRHGDKVRLCAHPFELPSQSIPEIWDYGAASAAGIPFSVFGIPDAPSNSCVAKIAFRAVDVLQIPDRMVDVKFKCLRHARILNEEIQVVDEVIDAVIP